MLPKQHFSYGTQIIGDIILPENMDREKNKYFIDLLNVKTSCTFISQFSIYLQDKLKDKIDFEVHPLNVTVIGDVITPFITECLESYYITFSTKDIIINFMTLPSRHTMRLDMYIQDSLNYKADKFLEEVIYPFIMDNCEDVHFFNLFSYKK